ncbi:MAG: EF-P 5-aminopentanol modification-associated protein YfmH [Candidatus Scatovivens sp.]
MQIIENDKIKEKMYIEKLDNGLTIILIPKKGVKKKYIIWGTHFGSVDNKFTINGEEFEIPDGIAHYLEHKMFEQRNGTNSLDVLSSLGVNANAYTTNDYTAYLYECTDNFYEALDEFMDYVQNPYYTDENVNKERGIIEQEIRMYEDYPEWDLYMNAMKLMYKNSAVNIDIAGTKESIAKIDKEKLYLIYNNFYRPENMAIVFAGDIEKDEILKEIKKRITFEKNKNIVKTIEVDEPDEIVEKQKISEKDISMPIFIIAYKDKVNKQTNMVKREIGLKILCNIIFGKSSDLYRKLYENGSIFSEIGFEYEYARNYAHLYIQSQSTEPQEVIRQLKEETDYYLQNGINDKDFERIKKKIYGDFVKDYNDVSTIGNMALSNFFKGINIFDYFEEFNSIDKKYIEDLLKEVFNEEKKVISITNPYDNKD